MQVTPQSHPKREEGVLECLSAILIGCWLRAALESDAPQLPHVGQAGTALRQSGRAQDGSCPAMSEGAICVEGSRAGH